MLFSRAHSITDSMPMTVMKPGKDFGPVLPNYNQSYSLPDLNGVPYNSNYENGIAARPENLREPMAAYGKSEPGDPSGE
jgi:hypothetical protein